MLKNGHSAFKLDILEYCAPSDVIKREQHYLSLLKPKYNILEVARSSKGFKHSLSTLELIREAALKREPRETFRHSLDTKLKIQHFSRRRPDFSIERVEGEDLVLHAFVEIKSLVNSDFNSIMDQLHDTILHTVDFKGGTKKKHQKKAKKTTKKNSLWKLVK